MLGFQYRFIMTLKAANPGSGLCFATSQAEQRLPAHLQDGVKGFTNRRHVQIEQAVHMLAPARPRDDLDVGVEPAHQFVVCRLVCGASMVMIKNSAWSTLAARRVSGSNGSP